MHENPAESPAEKQTAWQQVKTAGKWLGITTLLAFLPTAITIIDNIIQDISPHKKQQEFYAYTGVSLYGNRKYFVPNNTYNLCDVTEAIIYEQSCGGKLPEKIYLKSEQPWKKTAPTQFLDFFEGQTYSHPFFPPFSGIVLGTTNQKSIHHELKHIKHFLHPQKKELEQAWTAFAQDETGNSLYLSFFEACCHMVHIRGFLEAKQHTTENEKLGFVSNYARTWLMEDIAELCTRAETNPASFVTELYVQQNQRIMGKVHVAAQYGLLPREFLAYVALEKDFLACKNDAEKNTWMHTADTFLQAYPKTVYASCLLSKKGAIFQDMKRYEKAIAAYKKGLLAPVKKNYLSLIFMLGECYTKCNDEKKRALYAQAVLLYHQRYAAQDLLLPILGVNDFLQEQGEL